MTLPRLVLAYLVARPVASVLNMILIALGVATLSALLLVMDQGRERVKRDASPVDLVVGAKGSPLQLILSSLFHADVPTGNVSLAEAEKVAAHPMVASATPLALGDSYRGHRIVGTDPSLLALYGASVAQGRLFEDEMEAVVGSAVARRHGLSPGARISGVHGLAEGGTAHEDHPYQVTGILAPTGTVIDRLVLTSVDSVWHVHEHGNAAARREITALLIRYATPLAAAMLPRAINTGTPMQAASPAYETARLFELLGVGTSVIEGFAVVLVLGGGLSLLAGLHAALQQRRRDLALMRLLGARPGWLAGLALGEGVTLLLAGSILGLALGHATVEALGAWSLASGGWPLTGMAWVAGEVVLVGCVVGLGGISCLLPAWQAYRSNPTAILDSR